MVRARLLLLLLTALVAHTVVGHEARINPRQRRAIQARLEKQGCALDFSGVSGSTRGATRSLARRSPVDQALVPAAQRYSDYFSQVIQTEFDLPYGKDADPTSHTFFRLDPYEGADKIKVQEELGIRWRATGPPDSVPTWIAFARNYRAALEKRGIDPGSTFVPALVFYKETGPKKREYLFLDPLKEKFPDDIADWQMLTKDVQFNIPFAPIYEAMQQGKFPLLDATHDISHFVSFVRFPEFARTVRSRLKAMGTEEVSSAFKGREYWLTEAMSLPDPAGGAANLKFLGDQGRPATVREPMVIEKELRAMDEKALVEYAYRAARHLESQLRDVSGGNSNSSEKWFYLAETFGMSAEDLLKEDISRTPPIRPIFELGRVYFDNAPVSLHANPKALTNETATFNFNTLAAAQKLLALSLKENRLEGASKKEALDRLVQFASRTEHLLSQKPYSYEEWATAFMQPDLPLDHPISKTLTTLFPNDAVRKYYLGKGEPRPPKPKP